MPSHAAKEGQNLKTKTCVQFCGDGQIKLPTVLKHQHYLEKDERDKVHVP